MSASPDDISLLGKIGLAASGVVTALVSLVWADYRKRVERVETGLDQKADRKEVDRQRDNVSELFREQRDIRKETNDALSAIKDAIHENHRQVMTALSNKVDR